MMKPWWAWKYEEHESDDDATLLTTHKAYTHAAYKHAESSCTAQQFMCKVSRERELRRAAQAPGITADQDEELSARI